MTSPSRSATWTVARSMTTAHLTLAAAYLLIVMVVSLTVALLIDRFGTLETSIWEFAAYHLRWLAFTVGTMLTAVHLTVFVAHGLTRRTFLRGAAMFLALASVAVGALIALGYGLERLLFGAIDAPQGLTFTHLFDSTGTWVLAIVEYSLVLFAYAVGGWFVGTGYYRLKAVGGTLLILPGLVPLAAVELSGWGSGPGSALEAWLDDPATGLVVAVTVVACLAGLAAIVGMVRAVPIATKTT